MPHQLVNTNPIFNHFFNDVKHNKLIELRQRFLFLKAIPHLSLAITIEKHGKI